MIQEHLFAWALGLRRPREISKEESEVWVKGHVGDEGNRSRRP